MSDIKHRFLTNIRRSEIIIAEIALKAAHITNYMITDTATDMLGNTLPSMVELRIPVSATPKEVELFFRAYPMVIEELERRKAHV